MPALRSEERNSPTPGLPGNSAGARPVRRSPALSPCPRLTAQSRSDVPLAAASGQQQQQPAWAGHRRRSRAPAALQRRPLRFNVRLTQRPSKRAIQPGLGGSPLRCKARLVRQARRPESGGRGGRGGGAQPPSGGGEARARRGAAASLGASSAATSAQPAREGSQARPPPGSNSRSSRRRCLPPRGRGSCHPPGCPPKSCGLGVGVSWEGK